MDSLASGPVVKATDYHETKGYTQWDNLMEVLSYPLSHTNANVQMQVKWTTL